MAWRRFIDIRWVLVAILGTAAIILVAQSLTDDGWSSSSGEHVERIDAYVSHEMKASRIPGVSLAIVNSDGSVEALGLGEDGRGNPITADTPFWIGSNTKSFTALSIMQLAEAGKLDISAPVERYLPEFRVADEDASAAITVKNVLNQTSGLSRADGLKAVLDERVQTLDEAVAGMHTIVLNRPVGESYEYSNLNFVLAGLIVERVSSQTWAEYVQTHIFDPLEMRNSFTSLEAARADGLTAVHSYWFGFPLETEGKYLPGLAPTGYLYASAADMSHYLSMYLNGGVYNGKRLLSEAGIDEMLRGETNDSSRQLMSHSFDFQYGRGWFVGQFGAAEDARWHLGNLPTFTAWMVLLPDTHQAVVILMNAGSQFEIAGANEVMSRIPIGVVNVLRGELPPTGLSMSRFYVIFDALVLMVLALQVWSLGRVIRHGPSRPDGLPSWTLAAGPFLWEVGLSLYLLTQFPASMGATWAASLRSLPDLTVVVLAVSVLWLLTGVARAIQLGLLYRGQRGTAVVERSGQSVHNA